MPSHASDGDDYLDHVFPQDLDDPPGFASGAPQTREELLALPVIELSADELRLAVLKSEGSCYAAADDDGQWWVLEHTKDGYYRRAYPCAPF